jgi:hypothetical protein
MLYCKINVVVLQVHKAREVTTNREVAIKRTKGREKSHLEKEVG